MIRAIFEPSFIDAAPPRKSGGLPCVDERCGPKGASGSCAASPSGAYRVLWTLHHIRFYHLMKPGMLGLGYGRGDGDS